MSAPGGTLALLVLDRPSMLSYANVNAECTKPVKRERERESESEETTTMSRREKKRGRVSQHNINQLHRPFTIEYDV
jgi:hypothetical protein